MSTVADESPRFVRRQARLFDRMTGVPFRSYRLAADWARLGDLARPIDTARYPDATAVAIPVTEERYRLRGVDRAPAVEDLYYTFVERDGSWGIAEDRDLEDIGLDTTRHLWDFGPVRTRPAGRFVIFRHPCTKSACAHLPSSMNALLAAALSRVRRYWHGPIPRHVAVLVPSSASELRRMLQAAFDLTKFVAFAYSTVDEPRNALRFSGPRIILNWRSLEGRSPSSVVAVLAHELLHVVTRSSSGPLVPIFLEEGFADFAGNDASPASLSFLDASVAAGRVAGTLPEDYRFTTGSGDDIFLSYQEAQSAVAFFVRTWGLRAFESFYRRLGRARIAPGTAAFHVGRALQDTIGIGLGRFERAWAGSLGL